MTKMDTMSEWMDGWMDERVSVCCNRMKRLELSETFYKDSMISPFLLDPLIK